MSGAPEYGYRLTERGDLVRMEVAPNGNVEVPTDRNLRRDDFITPPPSPPTFPPPPPPDDGQAATTSAPLSSAEKTLLSGVSVKQTNGHIQANNNTSTPTPHPPLKLYADRDVRALEKNPMHGDIMNAAEKFKDRRDTYSVDSDSNSMERGEPAADNKIATEYLRRSAGVKHPVYHPENMKKKKSLIVNSEMRWSQPKPLEKRNTYTVIPNSQLPSYLANAQDSKKPQPKRAATIAEGLGYKRVQDIPEADALLDYIATHDEKGVIIPEWKRKLMARNYRVKLCNELGS